MKACEIVTVTQGELDGLLLLAKPTFPAEQYKLLEGSLATLSFILNQLQNAKISIRRFRRMLFGHSTESKKNVLAVTAQGDQEAGLMVSDSVTLEDAALQAQAPPKVRSPGHGRIAAADYSGASKVECKHADLKPGDPCPSCGEGRMYISPPSVVVRIVGQPPLNATSYERERLRCRLCDYISTAPLPDGVSDSTKFDASSATMIAMLKYGSGMPFHRIESLQDYFSIPIPDATQWDIIFKASAGPLAVYEQLKVVAAQAPLLHNDDTGMKVLSLGADRRRIEAEGGKPQRKAINTSAIVAVSEAHTVALYYTGHDHAGDNMGHVLAHRNPQLEPAIQMCDALAHNFCGEFETVVAKCLAHGRRQVCDVAEIFPGPAQHVLNELGLVYKHDAQCRHEGMSADQRLAFHQKHSQPIMDGLHGWTNDQFEQRLVEPNSGLGKALNYLIKHWAGLTLFLRVSGAPLDNNLCERALKKAILHRKASMFYKTLRGAQVGDAYMSLIHTCGLCKINPMAYLNALHRHAELAIANTALWLPWNYTAQCPADP